MTPADTNSWKTCQHSTLNSTTLINHFFFQSTSSPLKHSQILETGKTNTHKKNKVFFWKYGQLEELVRAKAVEEEATDVAVEVLLVDLLDVAVTVGPMSTSSCFRIASMAPISAPSIDLRNIRGFPISESASKRLRFQLHRRVQRARMYAIRICLSGNYQTASQVFSTQLDLGRLVATSLLIQTSNYPINRILKKLIIKKIKIR